MESVERMIRKRGYNKSTTVLCYTALNRQAEPMLPTY